MSYFDSLHIVVVERHIFRQNTALQEADLFGLYFWIDSEYNSARDDRLYSQVCASLRHCYSIQGIVKPTIVFFGEDLPRSFYKYMKDIPLADLVIVMGTSLEVRVHADVVDTCGDNVKLFTAGYYSYRY